MNGGEEISRSFIVAGRNGSKLLESTEEIFDQVARLIEFLVIRPLLFAVLFGRDHRGFPLFFQKIDDTVVGIIGFVGQEDIS